MEFFDVIKSRQSVRRYQDRPVEEEKLRTILETAASAPSAGNLQSYEIYVARRAVDRNALAQAASGQEFMASAPIALVFCANPGHAQPRYGQRLTDLYALQDATIACTYAMVAATALGLSSVWIGAFREEQVQSAIHVQEEVRPVAILAIGYAGEMPEFTPRREFNDLIHEL